MKGNKCKHPDAAISDVCYDESGWGLYCAIFEYRCPKCKITIFQPMMLDHPAPKILPVKKVGGVEVNTPADNIRPRFVFEE